MLCAADEDRYLLSVQAGETIDAAIAFERAADTARSLQSDVAIANALRMGAAR